MSSTIAGIDYAVSVNGHPSLSGKAFAFVKATEGTGYTESGYAAEAERVRAAGLVLGAYHFGWINEDIDTQATHFVETAKLKPGDLAFIDFEGYSDGRNWGTSWEQRDTWRLAWIAKVKQLLPGVKVGTYIDTSNWLAIPSDDPGDYLFIAQYTSASKPAIEHPWQFWQHGDSPVDQDYGNFVSTAALKTWAGTTTSSTLEDTMDLTADQLAAIGHQTWVATQIPVPPGATTTHSAATLLADVYSDVADLKAAMAPVATPTVDAAALATALASNSAFVAAIATAVTEQLAKRLAS